MATPSKRDPVLTLSTVVDRPLINIDGALYQLRWPRPRAMKCDASATSDFPEPVGVARITLWPANSSRIASSWWS